MDRPAPGLIAAFWLVVGLSAADAYLTVNAPGAHELNPVMGAALALGPMVFTGVKLALTCVGGAVLCLHGTWTLGRAGLLSAVVVYVFIVVYHVYGYAGLISPP
ncbi:MAG TPA: DUF5658 family protein [Methylomirabilota bacterium]|nr:DUF5658 family protein [Methylomirabilota bacterium]